PAEYGLQSLVHNNWERHHPTRVSSPDSDVITPTRPNARYLPPAPALTSNSPSNPPTELPPTYTRNFPGSTTNFIRSSYSPSSLGVSANSTVRDSPGFKDTRRNPASARTGRVTLPTPSWPHSCATPP